MEVRLLTGTKQDRETKKAMIACNDYLRLGPGRSLQKLLNYYQNTPKVPPPVKTLKTVKKWSRLFGWVERATAYDAEIERKKTEAAERRQTEAMQTGLALDYERVLKLRQLAQSLVDEIWESDGSLVEDKIWVPDVKQIGGGKNAERVDIARFNSSLLSEFRATLDDLAKETGGRKQKTELSGQAGGPVQIEVIEVNKLDE